MIKKIYLRERWRPLVGQIDWEQPVLHLQATSWNVGGVGATDWTAHRKLHEQGFHCRTPAVKPLLNAKKRQMRLKWCREEQGWMAEQWYSVMFSNESKFVISFGNKGFRVWKKQRTQAKCETSAICYGVERNVISWCEWLLLPQIFL